MSENQDVVENTDAGKTAKDILEEKKKLDQENKPELKNEKEPGYIHLGDLGKFKTVSSKECSELMDKLNGFVFKIHNCLFKVNFVNKPRRRFTAEILNEDKNIMSF